MLSETADVTYLLTGEYAPAHEAGIAWDDPSIGIDWPISEPRLSPRDQAWPSLT